MRSDWNFDSVHAVSVMTPKHKVTQDLETSSRVAPEVGREESHLSTDSSVSTIFASSLSSQVVHSTDKLTQLGEDKISRKEDTLSGAPRGYPLSMTLY